MGGLMSADCPLLVGGAPKFRRKAVPHNLIRASCVWNKKNNHNILLTKQDNLKNTTQLWGKTIELKVTTACIIIMWCIQECSNPKEVSCPQSILPWGMAISFALPPSQRSAALYLLQHNETYLLASIEIVVLRRRRHLDKAWCFRECLQSLFSRSSDGWIQVTCVCSSR